MATLILCLASVDKVRIEVGYGLEGTLTDALSSVIISSAIAPRFKGNDFSGGIERGVDGIISVLSGDTADWQPKPSVRADDPPQLANELFSVLFLLIIIFVIWSLIRNASGTSSGRDARRGGGIIFLPIGGSWGSSGRSGGFGGGGPDSEAVSPAGVVGREAEAPQVAGDGVHQRGSRGRLGRYTRSREAHLRTDYLRARRLILGLRICPDLLGDFAGAPRPMAVDRFHAMERATNFLAATRGLRGGGLHFLVDAASPGARAARRTACPGAPSRARTIRHSPRDAHAQSMRYSHLCIDGGALCAGDRGRGDCTEGE